MKLVLPGKKRPRNLKSEKDLVMEAWDRLYPGDLEAEKQEERKRLWAKEEINRKAKAKL